MNKFRVISWIIVKRCPYEEIENKRMKGAVVEASSPTDAMLQLTGTNNKSFVSVKTWPICSVGVDPMTSFRAELGKLKFIQSLGDEEWEFEYTDSFRVQNRLEPLVNFPSKTKVYKANVLWPFFKVRIPTHKQLKASGEWKEGDNDSTLLKRYGRRTGVNPFELKTAWNYHNQRSCHDMGVKP